MSLAFLKMDENLKNRLLITLCVFSLVFFFSTLSSCNSTMHEKASRNKEMAMRLALEERISKFSQETASLQEKAKAKEIEAQELKVKLGEVEKNLAQNQLLNQSLKEELQKASFLKQCQESDSKEALVNENKLKK